MGKNIKTQIGAFSELEIYKIALRDYKRANGLFSFLFYETSLDTSFGFCYYFNWQIGVGMEWLYTLNSLKPAKTHGIYWFTEGDREPRIALLKEAIKILEKVEK